MGWEISRRRFFKIFGSLGALGSISGCASRGAEKLIPYLVPSEDIVPGVATYYATVCRECPAGCGAYVRTREGRAVKAEGNPLHPVNAGRLCARGQASLLGLYNPDRIKEPLLRDKEGKLRSVSWGEAEKALADKIRLLRSKGAVRRMALMTQLVSGSLDALFDHFAQSLGGAEKINFELFAHEPMRAANQITFGLDKVPTYALDKANVILSFGADFLDTWISPVGLARRFGQTRLPRDGKMGLFIQVEPRLSITGANADEWIAAKPGSEAALALGLANFMLRERLASELTQAEAVRLKELLKDYAPEAVASETGVSPDVIARLARVFSAARPGVALAGGTAGSPSNATSLQVAVNLLNHISGNLGKTVMFGPIANLDEVAPFRKMMALIEEVNNGRVDLLVLHGVNPVYALPGAAGFDEALKRVNFIAAISSYADETTSRAHLVLPEHTPFESWGDYRPMEGVHGLMQPAMEPVFNTKSAGDILISMAKQIDEEVSKRFPWPSYREFLIEQWKKLAQAIEPGTAFEKFWQDALRRGGAWREVATRQVALADSLWSFRPSKAEFQGEGDFYLLPYASPMLFDGRGANRPWLQEVPDALAQIVWDGWAEIHPEAASERGIREGDLIVISSPNGEIEVPAHLNESLRSDVLAVPLGQGHLDFGRYASGVGQNPMRLLSAKPEAGSGGLVWCGLKVNIKKAGRRRPLVSLAGSIGQLGRDLAQWVSFEKGKLEHIEKEEEKAVDMYERHEHPKYRWAMAIDLSLCTGCSACVAACYAENNLGIVGKEQAAKGREMSWIRVERYFEGSGENLKVRFIPMLCQQCAYAPCEPVCPVYATYHTSEGLNAQIYNRCIGVRYCSNNCPYKVRRFNWFQSQWPSPLHWQLNPDVTVREVGLIEKCTFCVQRIREAKERAKEQEREVRDGEVVPACAQTCPTGAIVFGNLKEPGSRISLLSKDDRGYHVLAHLNTKPGITYLKKVVNKDFRGSI